VGRRALASGEICDRSRQRTRRLRSAPFVFPLPNENISNVYRYYASTPVLHGEAKTAAAGSVSRVPASDIEDTALGGGTTDRLGAMALQEATRKVTVREGDKISEIPAMQALLRTLIRSGAQGDIKAARQVLELISRAESGRTGAALETLEYAVQYKEKYGPIFEQRERRGEEPLDIFPHPDDIVINEMTGEVTIDGPPTKEHAGARITVREQALRSLRRYFEVEEELAKDPTNRTLRREFKELKKYHEFLKEDFERKQRHEVLRQSRRALETKPHKPKKAKRGPKA
jgi:hypothetical protein